jgi:multiple sugar transport system substrate-binding protein
VMTVNTTLSIPGELRTARPDDYYDNAATIDWPEDADGQPLVLYGGILYAASFNTDNDPALRDRFVRFLVEDGWLAHWLTFAGDRFLPPMRKLVEQPFWLDTGDPHRLRGAIQILTRQHLDPADVRDPALRAGDIYDANVWGKAVERVVVDGITPEQAVDEAIARIKEILGE